MNISAESIPWESIPTKQLAVADKIINLRRLAYFTEGSISMQITRKHKLRDIIKLIPLPSNTYKMGVVLNSALFLPFNT